MSLRKPRKARGDTAALDAIVARARKEQDEREAGYRARSLAIHPWVCGRCGRVFTQADLSLLTVHHKDGNHDNNPPDGSNWENLCVYCHENEHARMEDHLSAGGTEMGAAETAAPATHRPLAALAELLKKR